MSLYGSLFSSVSGIQAQGTAIGIISDNISNINTVGYKAGSQYFGTLVTNSAGSVAYSPGGVRAQNRQLISQQGLVQTTNSSLDVAISGNGMFVVKEGTDATDDILYTRAGSFRTDSSGNFVNASGLFLQAWTLDSNGDIPANSSSLDTLTTVNIGEAFGDAAATTRVETSINLDASQETLLGNGQTGAPGADTAATENTGLRADDIVVYNNNMDHEDSADGEPFLGDILRVTTDGTFQDDFVYGGFEDSADITGTILGASSSNQPFNGAGVASGDAFTIVVNGDTANPYTFTYVPSSPQVSNGEFNSLDSLANAIDAIGVLNARVATTGGATRLFVSAADARQAVTFAQVAGSTADFPTSLALADITATSNLRWNTMEGLGDLVNQETSDRLVATVNNPTSTNATISINNANPLTTIQFASVDDGEAEVGNSILDEFGFSGTAQASAYNAVAGSTASSMAAGTITPHFERAITIFDSLGDPHDVRVGFVKVANNTWSAEVYAADANDIISSVTGGDINDRFIAATTVTFNGDGSLLTLSTDWSASPFTIDWNNGANSSSIEFDLGTLGDSDGLRQFAGLYNVANISQNGAAVGLLDSVSIDEEGFIVANFNNGQSKALYKIPIATFSNIDGLQTRNGNAFIQTIGSGDANLAEAGTEGAGSISPSSLETANSDLSEELTDMIVAQRAYQASAKVITTADELLEELNRVT